MTHAIHANSGNKHGFAVTALRVLVVRDNDCWFARGIEIDYSATGQSVEDVRKRFERGFALTVQAHLRKFSTIERLLKWAPQDVIEEYEKAEDQYELDQVLVCEIENDADGISALEKIPFTALRYAYPSDSALAA